MQEQISVLTTELAQHEAIIERGLTTFIEVGQSLLAIRDNRLYRESHPTFEDYCQQRWGWERAHAYRLMAGAETAGRLSPIGDIPGPTAESQVRPLTSLPEDEQKEVWLEAIDRAAGRVPTQREVQQVVDEKRGAHVGHNTGEFEWYTPADYIESACTVMGEIDLDPASTAEANTVVRAKRFYTIEDDGLMKDWAGRVWMNPPYAQPTIQQFCERLKVFYEAGYVTEAIALTNNATETFWFDTLSSAASALCLPRGRIKFWNPEKDSATPLQGQAITYFGPSPDVFKAEFAKFGRVWS